MRRFLISATLAAFAVVSQAAPSQAGGYYDDCQPYCTIKKVRSYDAYGNRVIRKIRVCN